MFPAPRPSWPTKSSGNAMTSGQWLTAATTQLKTAGVSSAKLDALILLEDCLAVERSHILAHPEIKLKASQIKKLNKQVARRALHEPLAYIRGFSEFYGRQFMVNKHVLEPRPESETMITLLKNLLYHNPSISEDGPLKITTNERIAKIADVGTGSGCLGITATLEISGSQVDLYDTDTKALVVAKHNMALHGLHLRTSRCDLLSNCHSSYDVIVANLPIYLTAGRLICQ